MISFTGNVGKDPELRFLPNGDAVCNMNVAVTPRTKKGDEWVDGDVLWYRVTAWRYRAEAVAEHVVKGSLVFVQGRFTLGSYEKDGVTHAVAQVEADVVALVPKAQAKQQRGDAPPGQAVDSPW